MPLLFSLSRQRLFCRAALFIYIAYAFVKRRFSMFYFFTRRHADYAMLPSAQICAAACAQLMRRLCCYATLYATLCCAVVTS